MILTQLCHASWFWKSVNSLWRNIGKLKMLRMWFAIGVFTFVQILLHIWLSIKFETSLKRLAHLPMPHVLVGRQCAQKKIWLQFLRHMRGAHRNRFVVVVPNWVSNKPLYIKYCWNTVYKLYGHPVYQMFTYLWECQLALSKNRHIEFWDCLILQKMRNMYFLAKKQNWICIILAFQKNQVFVWAGARLFC